MKWRNLQKSYLIKYNVFVIFLYMKTREKTINKLGLISHKEVVKQLMKDPEFRRVRKEMAFEMGIFRALMEARIKHKLTQKQLADKIGIAQSALARFESGRIDPRLSFLKKVASGLGLTLSVK